MKAEDAVVDNPWPTDRGTAGRGRIVDEGRVDDLSARIDADRTAVDRGIQFENTILHLRRIRKCHERAAGVGTITDEVTSANGGLGKSEANRPSAVLIGACIIVHKIRVVDRDLRRRVGCAEDRYCRAPGTTIVVEFAS